MPSSSLPDQTGHAGNVLFTDGTDPYWNNLGTAFQLYAQIKVQENGIIEPDAVEFTSPDLIGMQVNIDLNGLSLPTNLDVIDQQGYTYDILTGEITFYSELNDGDILKIYINSPGLSYGNGSIYNDTYNY